MAKHKAPRRIRDRERQLNKQPEAPRKTPRWKLLLEVLAVLSAILGILGFVLNFLPRLSLDVSGSLRPHDPAGTVFYLSNDGVLSIHDVTVTCHMDDVMTQTGAGMVNVGIEPLGSHADTLSPGHKMTLPCAENIIVNRPARAKMTFSATYRPSFIWWHRTEEFPMEAMGTQDGNYIWKNLPK